MKIPCYRLWLGEPVFDDEQFFNDEHGTVIVARMATQFYNDVRVEHVELDMDSGEYRVLSEVDY